MKLIAIPALPLRAEKILRRVREMRGGALNDPRFHTRMSGQGSYAETLMNMFTSTVKRLGFGEFPEAKPGTFRRPGQLNQLSLFR